MPIQSRSPFTFDESLDDTLWNSQESGKQPKISSRESNTSLNSSRRIISSADPGEFSPSSSKTPPLTAYGNQNNYDNDRALWDSGAVTNYGSIIPSPPNQPAVPPPMLELPDPALSPTTADSFPRHNRAWRKSQLGTGVTPAIRRSATITGDAYEVGRTNTPSKSTNPLLPKHGNVLKSKGTFPTPDGLSLSHRSPFLRRMFSVSGAESPASPDVPLEAYRDYDVKQADFFGFLDEELETIENFYKMKEVEATNRLVVLRQQLHEMRDRRLQEVVAAQQAQEHARQEQERHHTSSLIDAELSGDSNGKQRLPGLKWMKPIEHAIGTGSQQFGKNTRALEHLGTPSGPMPKQQPQERHESWRDFTRRPTHNDDVPYRVAKRKLKLALQEFYRGLELLKSYALLNRTAFRKIIKKYDKAVNARPTGRYITEKVNKAWFVQSEVLDGHLVAVEDLYARYFERGNHKIAVGKLRVKHLRDDFYNSSAFRNGLFFAAGIVLGIQGIVGAQQHLSDPSPVVVLNTTYLLQVRIYTFIK